MLLVSNLMTRRCVGQRVTRHTTLNSVKSIKKRPDKLFSEIFKCYDKKKNSIEPVSILEADYMQIHVRWCDDDSHQGC